MDVIAVIDYRARRHNPVLQKALEVSVLGGAICEGYQPQFTEFQIVRADRGSYRVSV